MFTLCFLDLQNAFDTEWKEGRLTKQGWTKSASKEAILGFKLILLTGDPERRQNFERVSLAVIFSNLVIKVF